eukprot:CAMPEP_0202695698 /NCGR_PEP_ID=MMETSP1385-20130828/9237_1 /ASSEMBLY_ACC=CAM_ASM_000861 /TAXON_ID=933848 /ORGANISM="Elphidium margaritaceum" /LENGTH=845 /DNA_ID=CAMNT_0049351771 /DNA_START=43 /DNA_END=2580 /DNA_ORIENTATION=+
MKDAPPAHYRPRPQNLSRRINNPKIYSHDESKFSQNINVNVQDPEAQSSHPDERYIKDMTGRVPASMSFMEKSSTTLIREVSHEFDQFAFTLIGFGVVDIIIGFFVMSWSGILVISFAIMSCVGAFYYCSQTVRWIMSKGRGTHDMQIIADYIKEGSDSYLRTQYQYIASVAIITAAGLFFIYLFRGSMSAEISVLSLAIVTAVSFMIGAFCSAVAGYTGVWTSVRCNLRVAAAAAQYDYKNAFLLAFRGGAVSAILSAAMCILGIATLYIISTLLFVRFMNVPEQEIPLLLGGYGFGASFVALFMQLGGGIYTKAADVGADMCGKIEQGIPEDDPRNPAVIADLVGDNVGDCAGSMADVFESIAAEMIGTMILGATLSSVSKIESMQMYIFFPLIVHSLDLFVSIVGISLTVPRSPNEDPIVPMKRGYTVALLLAIVLFTVVCRVMLYTEVAPAAWWHFALCGMIGLLCAYFIVLITQYYTDYTNEPVKKIARASRTGHGTNIIAGIAVGMESTALPAITICVSLFGSYMLGISTGLPEEHLSGLFGTACATMGMLCTAVYVLSMNNFGPIADNAGGVVEMSEQPHDVRVITDRLDAVGNVTKAATKGYAVAGSALACFLLFNAFLDEIHVLTGVKVTSVDITKVECMIAGILGIMMVFLFTGWSIDAVGRTAQKVVDEVRRQFAEIPGIMQHQARPQYGKCVEIVTRSALKEMVRPALLALLMPVAVGLLFRFIGQYLRNDRMLGVECLAAFLQFGTMTGLLMAVFLDNSGGAWDNAKKLIESQNLKDTEAHKAAITGDTVGDPFKDTAGPALHVVITTMSTTALVLGPLFVGYASLQQNEFE